MAEPKFYEKSAVQLSSELKASLSLDLIQDVQDATLVRVHDDLVSYSQKANITSPHMPPHQYLMDSEDEIDEDFDDDERDDDYDCDYDLVNDDDYDESDIDDDNDLNNEKIKMEVFNRPPSRLGRPLSNPYKRPPKRNGPSIDRIKMENAFLKNQNNKLDQELEQCRLTIQALKNIVGQKDIALQDTRAEYQKSILQIRVLEALILSKHSKDGSIIVRSGGGGNNNNLSSILQEKETLKKMDIPCKPVSQESVTIDSAPQEQLHLTQPPLLESSTDVIKSLDEDDLIPPPLPPKRSSRRNMRRWSMDFGNNNHFGHDDDIIVDDIDEREMISNINTNITQITSSDNNTIISSPGTTPSSSTLTPTGNDLQRTIPRLLKRRTSDIFQSLASCRPSSTKNGYDHSPPSTPVERDNDDSNESVINEKSTTKKRKSAHSKLRKIFSR